LSKKDPYGQFAEVMRSTMSKHTQQAMSGLGAVLGTMTGSGVKLDDFKHEIQDYMVAELPGMFEMPERTEVGRTYPLGQGGNGGTATKSNDVVIVCKVVTGNG